MEKIGQPCIPSKVVENLPDAIAFTEEIGLPVIIRPALDVYKRQHQRRTQ